MKINLKNKFHRVSYFDFKNKSNKDEQGRNAFKSKKWPLYNNKGLTLGV